MDAVELAFRNIPRANFLPESLREDADIDAPIPIGYGQTNSQPYTVELMLRWLEPEPGNKVLDIGSGSGWTSALIAHIVRPKGMVYATEIVPELVEIGKENVMRLGIATVVFLQANKHIFGLPQYAPYDRILVSASARKLPKELVKQLAVGGKLVIPVNHDILEITKTSDISYDTEAHSGFSFVPLV